MAHTTCIFMTLSRQRFIGQVEEQRSSRDGVQLGCIQFAAHNVSLEAHVLEGVRFAEAQAVRAWACAHLWLCDHVLAALSQVRLETHLVRVTAVGLASVVRVSVGAGRAGVKVKVKVKVQRSGWVSG